MIRRPPRSTLDRSSAASDVYKRQELSELLEIPVDLVMKSALKPKIEEYVLAEVVPVLSLIHISEPTRPY